MECPRCALYNPAGTLACMRCGEITSRPGTRQQRQVAAGNRLRTSGYQTDSLVPPLRIRPSSSGWNRAHFPDSVKGGSTPPSLSRSHRASGSAYSRSAQPKAVEHARSADSDTPTKPYPPAPQGRERGSSGQYPGKLKHNSSSPDASGSSSQSSGSSTQKAISGLPVPHSSSPSFSQGSPKNNEGAAAHSWIWGESLPTSADTLPVHPPHQGEANSASEFSGSLSQDSQKDTEGAAGHRSGTSLRKISIPGAVSDEISKTKSAEEEARWADSEIESALPGARPAALRTRFGAAAIDAAVLGFSLGLCFVAGAFAFGISEVLSQLSRGFDYVLDGLLLRGHVALIFLAFAALLTTLYTTLCHATFGATLGKGLMGLSVVNQQGGPPSFRDSFWRSIFGGLLTVLGGFGPAWLLMDPASRGIHDRLVGTRVLNIQD